MVQEFKDFAVKGNAIDMAVGIIIGTAFGKIVSSLVNNVIMPPLALAIAGVNISGLELILQPGTGGDTSVTIKYGLFLQSVIDFLVIAGVIFAVIKAVNALARKEQEQKETAPSEPPRQEKLLEEIRDLLGSSKS
ncbi:MAG: large-conductance mechanosensitive channel protein MscL [Bdellovibrionales bacterium]|nr:large-conductance mechanosensitive channel protein MscL [Bdellovibrionales bacterium]